MKSVTAGEPHSDGGVLRRRIAAFTVDAVVVTVAVAVASRRTTRTSVRRAIATIVGSAVAGIPYHVVLEGAAGQTVGKRTLDIAVYQEDGQPCTPRAALVRTVLRLVDWLPAGYLLGFVSMALSDEQQRIGDRCANTVVVRTERSEGPRDEETSET